MDAFIYTLDTDTDTAEGVLATLAGQAQEQLAPEQVQEAA